MSVSIAIDQEVSRCLTLGKRSIPQRLRLQTSTSGEVDCMLGRMTGRGCAGRRWSEKDSVREGTPG